MSEPTSERNAPDRLVSGTPVSFGSAEHRCTVLSKFELNRQNYLLEISCPEIVGVARPGQFVNLDAGQFLRRPLGIAHISEARRSLTVGFQVKGKGTQALSRLEHGDRMTLLGPLGHGFEITRLSQAIIVSGGTGVFPMWNLLETLAREGTKTAAAFGFRSKDHVILEDQFRAVCRHVAIASEAGDLPVSGTVMNALDAVIRESGLLDTADLSRTAILACGPVPMLKAVASFAKEKGIACQVSLEERMSCGTGYCRTCSCKTKTGEGADDWTYDRVCAEGPVFPAERVIFDE